MHYDTLDRLLLATSAAFVATLAACLVGVATGAFWLSDAALWVVPPAGAALAVALVLRLDLPAPAPEAEDAEDEAWLLARARGQAVPPPSPQRAASYARLEGLLRHRPPSAPARPGWQRRVLDAIDAIEKKNSPGP